MRKAEVKVQNATAGWLTQDEKGYHFEYDKKYLETENPESVSLTLPIEKSPFHNKVPFPFFDGLIPEGWLLEIAEQNWKLNPRDRMGLLLACCEDCIGAVGIYPVKEGDS